MSETETDGAQAEPAEDTRGPSGRRQVLKLAGVAALGAVGAAMVEAAPAGAVNPSWILDQDNSGTGSTNLSATITDPDSVLQIVNEGGTGKAIWAITNGELTSPVDPALTAETDVIGGVEVLDSFVPIPGNWGSALGAVTTGTLNESPCVDVTHDGLGTGVAVSANLTGVSAVSNGGYGVQTQGGLAPIQLVPASTAGPPTADTHALGELYTDSNGILYRCVAAGSPGVWAPMYTTVFLASPVRVIDTRDGTGGITGPMSTNTAHTSSDLTGGSSGIPTQALGLVASLTMVAETSSGNLPGAGFLAIFPGGTTYPGTSNVNAGTTHAIASGVSVALGTGSSAGTVSLYVGGATPAHALLDVAAYII